jgi:glycosyltransferase involved in cell wall biosynthesis
MLDELVRRAQSRGLGAAAFARAERALGVSAPPADGDPAPRRQGPGGARPPGRPLRAPAHAYQTRRDVNLERLNRADALVIGSQRAADVIRELGVAPRRLHVLALNPPHIESLTLRRAEDPGRPLRFVALNACNSAQKGAELIVAAVARLAERGFGGTYRLAVHGWVVPSLRAELAAHPEVELRGDYRVEDLDALLEDADVGLFPSVWEEVYGFVGLEFIAKGIPVIGNARGAIPEYVRPGETGWLNHSCTAAELADLMAAAITDPDRVARLAASTAAARDRFVRPFAEGLAALAAVYDELAGRRRAHDTTP